MNNQRIVIEDLHNCLKEIDKLIKENEKLKSKIKDLNDILAGYEGKRR